MKLEMKTIEKDLLIMKEKAGQAEAWQRDAMKRHAS
jgi:hypothetical protein